MPVRTTCTPALSGANFAGQLGIDKQFELLERHHPSVADAVDDEAGRGRQPQALGKGQAPVHLPVTTLRNAGIQLALVYALPHLLGRVAVKKPVVGLPILALHSHALRHQGFLFRSGVNVQGKVFEHQPDLGGVGGQNLLYRRLLLLAVGARVVAELIDGHLGIGRAPEGRFAWRDWIPLPGQHLVEPGVGTLRVGKGWTDVSPSTVITRRILFT